MKKIKIFHAGIHMGEERAVYGNEASGMINFSGCNLKCSHCYTPEASRSQSGNVIEVDPKEFLEILDRLVRSGAKNINLITPNLYWNDLTSSFYELREKYTRSIPLVVKLGGFESMRVVERMAQLTDVVVPDFKVWSPEIAKLYNLPENYGRMSLAGIVQWMQSHGQYQFDAKGKMQRGILIRHLLMPGAEIDSLQIVRRLADVGYEGYINFMSRFLDPKQKRLFRANPNHVRSLVNFCVDKGIYPLVDGLEVKFNQKVALEA